MHVCVQVILSFLLVGHTHEDIDQMFSKIAAALKSEGDVLSVDRFIEVVEGSFHSAGEGIHVEELEQVRPNSWVWKMFRIFKDASNQTENWIKFNF
jgi:hypothetical protein